MSDNVAYRVYEAKDGCAPSFCGEFECEDDAVNYAESNPNGLPQHLWATAIAAGHCAGMCAPDGGIEDDEPISWHGEDGWHCVVRVQYS